MSKESEFSKDLKNWSNKDEGMLLNSIFNLMHSKGVSTTIATLRDYCKDIENEQVK